MYSELKVDLSKNRKYSLRRWLIFSILLTALWIGSPVYAAEVSLTWDPNNETTLAGYKLYYGTSSQNYTESVDVDINTAHTLENLEEGQTYYFALTAYDTEGNESGFSNEISYEVPLNHRAPSSAVHKGQSNPMPWIGILLLTDHDETQ